jgi:hypothetical protein
MDGRVDALADAPPPGAPRKITDEQVEAHTAANLTSKAKSGITGKPCPSTWRGGNFDYRVPITLLPLKKARAGQGHLTGRPK